ncbi:tRNA pseudouridine(38-40) synthase TruA [Candidatus Aciduliprofundum boonei]|uniref:tRNA pseudouridine synthase A n=1 Tax=Aciduliprofundum boonei (strain DSM 19572 / T469) TaxID=439481 RepID=D3TB52_ACIB4|nr:tRNA pseudouridine(38-40) synthase TruA [Candidatus Aciduliprofundum boonei]ADD09331.1 Pseudouridine synthase I, TruA, alpha/beta domain protein [Aciduliprofundum boonei T469]HII55200.1 tRNA pseudouridine(38-40) synthase TruA [Candidatus Aciduliprofundum boonei]
MLLKFAYDGTRFYGYQRQKDVPTVEGEILKALENMGIKNLKSASRTDRGVSALGNVIWIKTDIDGKELIGRLNANLKHIYFHSFANLDINPRYARIRWYRYHLLDMGQDMDRLKEAAMIFQGEHDFRNFTRVRKNTVIEIKKIDVNKRGSIITIDFYGRNYLWNLIRRIVAAMETYSLGKEFGQEIFTIRKNFGIAPPEPLILMDIQYDFQFEKIGFKKDTRRFFSTNFFSRYIYFYLANPEKNINHLSSYDF